MTKKHVALNRVVFLSMSLEISMNLVGAFGCNGEREYLCAVAPFVEMIGMEHEQSGIYRYTHTHTQQAMLFLKKIHSPLPRVLCVHRMRPGRVHVTESPVYEGCMRCVIPCWMYVENIFVQQETLFTSLHILLSLSLLLCPCHHTHTRSSFLPAPACSNPLRHLVLQRTLSHSPSSLYKSHISSSSPFLLSTPVKPTTQPKPHTKQQPSLSCPVLPPTPVPVSTSSPSRKTSPRTSPTG